jgi:predicted hotdog family 3-hydroxylacyl-ACP dehydratase
VKPKLPELLLRLPHRPPMLFLDDVVDLLPEGIVTETVLRPGFLLEEADGTVSPLVALELFAQASAAYYAAHTAPAGPMSMQGALLGTRKLDVLVPCFRIGDVLQAEVRESWGTGGLAQFAGVLYRVEDGAREKVAEGAFTVAASLMRKP